jgi:hypothetical protein
MPMCTELAFFVNIISEQICVVSFKLRCSLSVVKESSVPFGQITGLFGLFNDFFKF